MTNSKSTSKKSIDTFIEEVIVPIENYRVPNNQLYVFVPFPIFNYREGKEVPFHFIKGHSEWPLPLDNKPGEWRFSPDQNIHLESISTALLLKSFVGALYIPEFEGETKEKSNLFFSPGGMPKEIEHFYNCFYKGLKVYKARLLYQEKVWSPYLLWNFLIDCAQKVYINWKNSSEYSPVMEGIFEFSRAKSKHACLEDSSALELIIGKTSLNSDFDGFVEEKEKQLAKNLDAGEWPFEKAILALCSPFTVDSKSTIGEIMEQLTTEDALSLMASHRDEYQIPGIFTKTDAERPYVDRIWYACRKKTIDWQTEHLIKMLNLDP